MDLTDLNIELGLGSGKQRVGYGTTAKVERFPDQAVLIMEAFEVPKPGPDGKTPKIGRKFRMSGKLAEQLEFQGKDFQKSDDYPYELAYFGHSKTEDGSKELFLINATKSSNKVVRSEACRATQSLTFSNKGLYDALCEKFGIDEGEEALFTMVEIDPNLTGGMPAAHIQPFTGVDMQAAEAESEDEFDTAEEEIPAEDMAEETV